MEKFNTIIVQIFDLPASDIKDSLTPKDIPSWDSMNYLLFISEVEKQFNVSFDMDEVLNASSLGDIKKALQKRGISI